jgi:hypothetical protein
MIEFTPEAEARLAEYLRQVHAALGGSPDVNPEEIEADIREHVENELRAAPAPVGTERLERVLDQLGPPSQWGAGERPSIFRRVKQRLRFGERLRQAREAVWRGPEDWRLAYLAFGVFAMGILAFPFFPLFLVLAYILGRAGIALAREKGIELGAARKWLLYPPVAIVSLTLLLTVLAVPVVAGGVTATQVAGALQRVESFERDSSEPLNPRDWRSVRDREARQAIRERMASQLEEDRELLAMIPIQREWAPAVAGLFVGAGALAMWGMVLALAGATYPRAVRAVFLPFCNGFERRHGIWLAIPSTVATVVWFCVAWETASAAGLI